MNRFVGTAVILFLANASAAAAQDANGGGIGNVIPFASPDGGSASGSAPAAEGAGGSGGPTPAPASAAEGSGGSGAPTPVPAAAGSGSGGSAAPAAESGSSDIEPGKKCFDKYTSLSQKFDPQYISMIDDDARIEFTFVMADGTNRVISTPAPQFKQSRMAGLTQEKAANNKPTYSDIDVKTEGSGYRVEGTVHFAAAGVDQHFSGLISVDGSQNCHIQEIKQTLHTNLSTSPPTSGATR